MPVAIRTRGERWRRASLTVQCARPRLWCLPTLVSNGPFLPVELLQLLEDERLVIFCGAGISIPAGLPDFPRLVRELYGAFHKDLPAGTGELEWPDRLLGDLERECGTTAFRGELVRSLNKPPKTLHPHKALVRLARLADGRVRLVSTNFDRYLPTAAAELGITFLEHEAPAVPVPEPDGPRVWASMVHLHGKLDPGGSNAHLVVTSGDFGTAYLRHGWAARFVAGLVASFSVLFVGYSVQDPVMRYMMDAFAAERASGRSEQHRAFALFGTPGGVPREHERWRAIGLEPIFYDDADQHRALYDTLDAWVDSRADWLSAKEKVIRGLAASPSGPLLGPEDKVNLLWAIAGGGPNDFYGAGVLARLGLSTPAGWIGIFEEHDRALSDSALPQFRPATLLSGLTGAGGERPSSLVERLMAHWIAAQIAGRADPDGSFPVLAWAVEHWRRGSRLGSWLRQLIRERLDADPPIAPAAATVWRTLSSEVQSPQGLDALYIMSVFRSVRDHGPRPDLIAELVGCLEPQIVFEQPFMRRRTLGAERGRGSDADAADDGPTGLEALAISDLVGVDVRLVGEEHLTELWEPSTAWPRRAAVLGAMTDQLTTLLLKVLDLFATFGKASRDEDPGVYARPSIRPHEQNEFHYFRSWTRLIDLLWAGWEHLEATAPSAARALVERWRHLPYPTFRRLALAAIAASAHWSTDEKADALL